MKPVGYFTFLLHTHIPRVLGHGVWPHGSDWLMEASTEAYLPLLETFTRLRDDGVRSAVTVSLTPVLMDQLVAPGFDAAFRTYVEAKVRAAEVNEARFAVDGQSLMASLAEWWKQFYLGSLELHERKYVADPLGALRTLVDECGAELIPSAVTHAYLPLLGNDACVRAQVQGAVRVFTERLGRRPAGFWLPECGYRPADPGGGRHKGIDEFLIECGVRYFVTDHHLLTGALGGGYGYRAGFISGGGVTPSRQKSLDTVGGGAPADLAGLAPERAPEDRHDPMLPLEPYLVESGAPGGRLAVFSREPQASLQVWSHEFGYPGSGEYLEFHKKHHEGGLRYWRVTDRHAGLELKEPYDPEAAEAKAREHAAHFVSIVRARLTAYAAANGRPGTMIAPFDTELFGHWWFEGPVFVAEVLRLLPQAGVEVRTCAEQLDLAPPRRAVRVHEGSWGEGGDHRMWLNMFTVHMWEEVHRAEESFAQIASRHAGTADLLLGRILRQMARTLMLLESSDWFFLVTTATARDYAEERFTLLLYHFKVLKAIAAVALGRGELGEKEIDQLEAIERNDELLGGTDLLAEYR